MSLTRLAASAPQCCVDADNKNKQSPGEVTRLLQTLGRWRHPALDALWPMVYDDVRRLARRQMAGERGDHTLQGTALVNEAFIRLAGQRAFEWQNREQFLSLAAQIMRRVLVDYARQRGAQRRGDGAKKVSLHDTQAAIEVDEAQALNSFDDERVDVLAIDTALDASSNRSMRRRAASSSCVTSAASRSRRPRASPASRWPP